MKIKNLAIKILTAAWFVMQGICTYAQLSTHENPVSFSKNNLQWHASAVTLPALDMAVISREDSIDKANGLLPRFGYPHQVNFTLENAGEWKVLPNGDRLWNLTITCPDAKSINLLYDKYWLPEGAKLFVYSKDRTHIIGAFTSKNNKGTNDEPQGFATELIFSDTVTVEYFEPKDVAYKGIVSISHVVQGYTHINFDRSCYGYQCSGSCQVNVNCSEGQNWQQEKNAVAMMIVEGSRYGTGFLINTTADDYKPLLLTSNLCINTYDAITRPNLYNCLFYWKFESPSCTNPATRPTSYTTHGAKVLANKNHTACSDFALLSLSEDPKYCLNVPLYYLGWDNSGNAGTSFVFIHHPRGDVKKIATRNASPYSSGNFWDLYWDQTANGHSLPEDGSYGGPLINGNRHVVGHFSYGINTNCSYQNQTYSTFGKFSVSWTGNGDVSNHRKLQPWLDSLNTGSTTHNGVSLANDLYVRDSVSDNGAEPSQTRHLWNSPDIWLEDCFENAITNPYGNTTCYVCVRVYNRNDYPSRGTERLLLNWAKAGVDLVWNNSWSGNIYFNCGQPKGGFIDSVLIPSIPANGSKVVKVSWTTPSLSAYENCTEFGEDRWHFCLLARVHDGNPIAHESETNANLYQMIRNHNNVALRNVYFNQGGDATSVVVVGNPKPINIPYNLRLLKHANTTGETIADQAEVYITLDAELLNSVNGTISGAEWVNSNTLRLQETDMQVPLLLEGNSSHSLKVAVHYLADILPQDNTTDFDIVLQNAINDSILGGEHYRCIRTQGRYFQATANGSTNIVSGQSTLLYANDIMEPATYEWFDEQGNSVGVGLNCNVTPTQTTTYTLAVTADADGYRAYDYVTVTVREGWVTSISPNPANGQVTVSYRLAANVASAVIQLLNGNGQVVGSYPVSGSSSVVTGNVVINTSSMAAGNYTVRMVSSTGKVNDSKTLIIQ